MKYYSENDSQQVRPAKQNQHQLDWIFFFHALLTEDFSHVRQSHQSWADKQDCYDNEIHHVEKLYVSPTVNNVIFKVFIKNP